MVREGDGTYLGEISEAWYEFKEGVSFRAFCLGPDGQYGPKLPTPIAWLCAPWRPLAYRFRPDNLDCLFRPKKSARRARLSNLSEYVFVCGGAEMTDEEWAEADALVAEFGIDFPPRDWEPMTAAETVGAIMGMSREEVAEIAARPAAA